MRDARSEWRFARAGPSVDFVSLSLRTSGSDNAPFQCVTSTKPGRKIRKIRKSLPIPKVDSPSEPITEIPRLLFFEFH